MILSLLLASSTKCPDFKVTKRLHFELRSSESAAVCALIANAPKRLIARRGRAEQQRFALGFCLMALLMKAISILIDRRVLFSTVQPCESVANAGPAARRVDSSNTGLPALDFVHCDRCRQLEI